ncbi:MAG: aldehyde dehydrogenase family protein [Verrucomicrobiota bacterium]
MSVPEIPVLRIGAQGEAYESLEVQSIQSIGNKGEAVKVHFANSGLVKRDMLDLKAARKALRRIPCRELLGMVKEAGERFLHDTLPLGLHDEQSPDDYVRQLSATSGLPVALVRRNMGRLKIVFDEVETILQGLSRGITPGALDQGYGQQNGLPVSFVPSTDALAVILPSNSPAVNALWIPSIAMQIPVILKPGREEPWTPWRIIQAMIASGVPKEAFGFYPTDHEGSNAIIRRVGRVMLFGDDRTVAKHAGDPRVEVHGTGRSKVLFGQDQIDDWEKHLGLLEESVSANSGRSCINASTIVVPRHADALAEALAQRLLAMEPKALDDESARLSGFANPRFGEAISGMVDEGLKAPGARDVSVALRSTPRLIERDHMTYLQPTVVRCDSLDHPLANTEFLFPYCAVVELPQEQMLEQIGPSLVVTALTEDREWIDDLLAYPAISRLNIGPHATCHISWDQPHEGNLFEFLFERRTVAFANA